MYTHVHAYVGIHMNSTWAGSGLVALRRDNGRETGRGEERDRTPDRISHTLNHRSYQAARRSFICIGRLGSDMSESYYPFIANPNVCEIEWRVIVVLSLPAAEDVVTRDRRDGQTG